jgi:alkylation response protein AidB-like acyl-CoA dehydrogenase
MPDHRIKDTREAAMAKSMSPQIGIEACNNAMATFGHPCRSSERTVEQRTGDAYGFESTDGTAGIQEVVARDFTGTECGPMRGGFTRCRRLASAFAS